KAVIIDAVIENVERDLKTIDELGLILVYAVETHIHADHITGASMIKDRTGAQSVFGGGAKGVVTGADMFLQEGQELRFGNTTIKALATPGHTDSCTSYFLPGAVFTGDTLFIRSNGRTVLQTSCSTRSAKNSSCCRTVRLSFRVMTITAGCHPPSARRSNSTNV